MEKEDPTKKWSDIQKKIVEDQLIKELLKGVLTTQSQSEKLTLGGITAAGFSIGLIIANLTQLNTFYDKAVINSVLILILASLILGFIALFFNFLSHIYSSIDGHFTEKAIEILDESEKEQLDFEKTAGVFPEVGIDWGRIVNEFLTIQPKFLRWQNVKKHYDRGLNDPNYIMKKAVKRFQLQSLFLTFQIVSFLASVVVLICYL